MSVLRENLTNLGHVTRNTKLNYQHSHYYWACRTRVLHTSEVTEKSHKPRVETGVKWRCIITEEVAIRGDVGPAEDREELLSPSIEAAN